MTTKTKKDLSVETLRGIAIILVVMGHVIGSKSDGGMKVPDDSFLRHLYFTFQYLRMPLFTVISGWVYALRPARLDKLGDFTIKKIRRILIPLIFVGGTYYIVQSIVPGTNFSYELKDIWRIVIFPYTFYWYLQSLFIVFLIVSVIDSYNLAQTFNKWMAGFSVKHDSVNHTQHAYSRIISKLFWF
jgi:glucans biosynthesis protein C